MQKTYARIYGEKEYRQAASCHQRRRERMGGVSAILGLYLLMLEQRRLEKEITWIETPRAHN